MLYYAGRKPGEEMETDIIFRKKAYELTNGGEVAMMKQNTAAFRAFAGGNAGRRVFVGFQAPKGEFHAEKSVPRPRSAAFQREN